MSWTEKFKQPEWIVASSAALWGLFWIPLRAFEEHGLNAAWTTLSQFFTPLLVLLPFAVLRRINNRPTGLDQVWTGVLVGAAFALYCQSLLLTDVVRALILFYIMPSWGTLLECLVLGRQFTRWRALALVLGMAGLIIIVRADQSLGLVLNAGDIMALLSGVVFAFGALRIRTGADISVFEQLFSFFFYGSLAALALVIIVPTGLSELPAAALILDLLPWIFLMTLMFLIPVMAGIYWGSGLVDPGRLGILLQLEAVVGIGSAALFTSEIFGVRETVGAALVISAGLVEVLGSRK